MKIANETKVGILAVFAITLMIFGYNFLKGKDLFSDKTDYFAVYPRIDGLTASNPVLVNGFTVGRVRKLKLLPDGMILVRIGIKNEITFPKNSVARIVSSDLLGSKSITLILGDSPGLAQPGDTLKNDIELSLTESVNKQVLPVKLKAENLMASLDSVMISLNYIITPKFRNSISRSVSNLEKSTEGIDSLIVEQRQRLSVISGNIEALTIVLRENEEKIRNTIANVELISDNIAQANLTQLLADAETSMAQTKIIVEKINQSQGSLGLMVNDKALYNNLTDASKSLDELLSDLKGQPKRYVNFSLFGGGKSKTEPLPQPK
ncbi:MAG: phospholipid/cholesterol/gamma-HCH transport system substrate-binding protein [Sphingobacteriales bacterium]